MLPIAAFRAWKVSMVDPIISIKLILRDLSNVLESSFYRNHLLFSAKASRETSANPFSQSRRSPPGLTAPGE
jgi:hypothetical protein